MADLKERKDMV
jgi:hypothetical protein